MTMPTAGKCWWHVILSMHGTWLPGDPRGFRSRDHRIHSSGDYKHRPPVGEHAGLHAYHSANADKVVLAAEDREIVGLEIWSRLQKRGHRVRVIAVSFTHAHFLAELPIDEEEAKAEVGEVKRCVSLKVRSRYPDKLWARLGDFNRVETRDYWNNAYNYILNQADSWIHCIQDDLQAQG
jgi:hypothetical protein